MRFRFTIVVALTTLTSGLSTAVAKVPSHECVNDSRAQSTLRFAQSLMTSPDSLPATERAQHRLPRLSEHQLSIVTSKTVCERAANAYAHRFGPGASVEAIPERITLVQAGNYYFVENLSPGEGGEERNEEFWEIQVFTSSWHPVVGYGGGS
jgi:hypothetical protein